MAAPNIGGLTTITGKTTPQVVSTTATAIISNAGSSGQVLKVNALLVSNVDNTTAYSITVDLYRSSTAYRIATAVSVPANATLDIINKSFYLEEGDSLRLTANSASKLEAVASYEVMA